MKTSQPSACTSTGSCAAYCTASTHDERADRVRELGDAREVDDRADGIRRRDARDDAHALVELPLEIVEVEPQVLGDVDPVDLEAAVGRELDPRRDAAVVVEARDEDPVAFLPVARRRAREREVEHRHVRAEDHVVGRAVEEPARVRPRGRQDPLDALARLVVRADVRRRLAQRARDRVADLVRNLRAAGRVEEHEVALQRREPAPHRLRRRVASCSWTERTWAHRHPRLAHHPRLRQLRRHRLARPRSSAAASRASEAFAIMDAAWEAGITTFDTADAYGGGRSETFIGDWLAHEGAGRARRDRPLDEDVQPDGRGRRPRARAGARAAPARVEPPPPRRRARRRCSSRTRWDPDVPIAETARRARRAPRGGQARRVRAEQRRRRAASRGARRGRASAGCRTRTRCSTARTSTRCCRSAPSTASASRRSARSRAAGSTGKYRRGEAPPPGSRMTMRPEPYEHLRDDRIFDALEALERLAATSRARPRLRSRSRGSSPIRGSRRVIVGPRRPEQLEPALAALGAEIDRETIERLFEPA